MHFILVGSHSLTLSNIVLGLYIFIGLSFSEDSL